MKICAAEMSSRLGSNASGEERSSAWLWPRANASIRARVALSGPLFWAHHTTGDRQRHTANVAPVRVKFRISEWRHYSSPYDRGLLARTRATRYQTISTFTNVTTSF